MTRIFHRQIGHFSPPRRGTGDHLQPAPLHRGCVVNRRYCAAT